MVLLMLSFLTGMSVWAITYILSTRSKLAVFCFSRGRLKKRKERLKFIARDNNENASFKAK
jgi:hypothetical protein